MTKTEIVEAVLSSIGWGPNEVLKPGRSNSPELLAEQFISALVSEDTIPKTARRLGMGEQTINRVISRRLIPIFGRLHGGGETWKRVLLHNAEIKYCPKCCTVLPYSAFTVDSHKLNNISSLCKECNSLKNAKYYQENKDTYHARYIDEHRAEYNARNSYRRARKLKATPSWADLAKIKQIYRTCPPGYHVDHVYPLISDWVCGLHVHENLQHLPAEENLRKGNRNTATVA